MNRYIRVITEQYLYTILVFPAKIKRAVFDYHVDDVAKEVCLDIENGYQLKFLEISTDKDQLHFLVQSFQKDSSVVLIVSIFCGKTCFEAFGLSGKLFEMICSVAFLGELCKVLIIQGRVSNHNNLESCFPVVMGQ